MVILLTSFASAMNTNGLVSYYPLTSNAEDAYGSYDGTVSGATLIPGQGYNFDGLNDCITITTPSYYVNQTNFTIIMWINTTHDAPASDYRLFDWDDASNNGLYVAIDVNNVTQAVMKNDIEQTNGDAIPMFGWYMVAYRFNNTNPSTRATVDYFFNGTWIEWDDFDAATPSYVVTPASASDAYIGCNDAVNRPFNGTLKQISIWNRGLSNAEMQAIHTNYSAGGDPINITAAPETIYYVANNGSDSNTGLSINDPIQTITKLNTLTGVGSIVDFQKGDSWYEDEDAYITMGINMTIGSYGSKTEKPILYGGRRLNAASFVACGTNLWCNITSVNDDYMPWFNNFTIPGLRNWTISAVNQQGHFTKRQNNITIYSVGNPATYYSDVYFARREEIINLNGISGARIENLSLKGSANMAVRWQGEQDNNKIRFNTISYIGGGNFSATSNQFLGNAIEIYGGGINNIIENNTIMEILDACISPQYSETANIALTNLTIKYNICYHSGYGIEIFQSDSGSTFTTINIDHNSFIANDAGIFKYMRQASGQTIHERGMRIGTSNSTTGIRFTNNIIVGAEEYAIGSSSGSGFEGDTFGNNNTFYSDYNNIYRDITTGYTTKLMRYYTLAGVATYSNIAAWKAASGKDTHSISENTLFIDAANGDFRPIVGSGVCTASSTGSYIGALSCYADTTPPANITSLSYYDLTNQSLILNWTNPTDLDYSYLLIFQNGSFIANVSSIDNGFTVTSLNPNTGYNFTLRPFDTTGNGGTNSTILITTLSNNATSSGTSGVFTLTNSLYVYNLTFLQKPYFLYFNMTENNTNPKVYDWQRTSYNQVCDLSSGCGFTDDNDFGSENHPVVAEANIWRTINKTFYNYANYTGKDLFVTIYFKGRYNSPVTIYCQNTTGNELIVSYTSTSGSTAQFYDYNVSVPLSCRTGADIKIDYWIKNLYASGLAMWFYEGQLFSKAPYYIQMQDVTIFNSTDEVDNTQFFNLTGRANNMTGNVLNFTFGTAYENTFGFNISYALIYNKSIFFRILNPLTKNLTNATCSYNSIDYGRNDTFNLSFVSSSENILRCSENNVYGNTSYTVGYPEDIINVTMNSIYAFECSGAAGEAVAYNFTVKDEDNWTALEGNNLYVDLLFGQQSLSFQKNNTNSIALCVQNGQDYIVNGDIRISNGYYTKYFLRNAPYNNQTRFITLYDKSDISAYSDLVMTIRDAAFLPMEGIISKLERYYPANHTWITVQQDISGAFGNVFFKIIEETTEYRFSFYRNASILSSTNDIKFKCTSGLCSVTYNIQETESTAAANIVSYGYDNDTQILSVSWNDATGSTSFVRVLVTKETFTGRQIIVDDTVYASSASRDYDLSGNTGTFSIKIYQDSDTPTINDYLVVNGDAIYRFLTVTGSGFWSFFIMAIFIGMGILNPLGVIFMGLVGLFIISILGINPVVDIPFIILVTVIAALIGNKVN